MIRETRKRAYSPFKRVKTYFVGEPGKDTGGLTRELWSLLSKNIQQSLCEGKENCLVLRHDATKLRVYKLAPLSIIVTYILFLIGGHLPQSRNADRCLHWGAAYPYFAPSFFSYICGVDVCSITASQDEIPDFEIHQALQKVLCITIFGCFVVIMNVLFQITSVEDSTQLQDVAQSESEMLLSCGFTKPFATLSLKDIPSIIESITLHTTILKVFKYSLFTSSSQLLGQSGTG